MLKRTTPPAVDPFSLLDAKAHLIVGTHEDNELIASLVKAATLLVEEQSARQLITAGWTFFADGFPCGSAPIELRVCPVQSVTEIRYVGLDGAQQTLDAESFIVDTASEPARIVPIPGTVWPSTQRRINAVEVEFTAGYGDRYDVPETAKQAIKLLVGHWYANRESVVVGSINGPIALAYQSLVNSLKWTV